MIYGEGYSELRNAVNNTKQGYGVHYLDEAMKVCCYWMFY